VAETGDPGLGYENTREELGFAAMGGLGLFARANREVGGGWRSRRGGRGRRPQTNEKQQTHAGGRCVRRLGLEVAMWEIAVAAGNAR
jgi:hypothetical protein